MINIHQQLLINLGLVIINALNCFLVTVAAIIIINIVHEVQNKYKHKRKAEKKGENMTVATSLYAQIFYGRTDVIFANSTVR